MRVTVSTDRILHVRVHGELGDELRLAAKREGNAVSALVRRLLTIGLRTDSLSERDRRG